MPPILVPGLAQLPSSIEEAESLMAEAACVLLSHQWPAEPKRPSAAAALGCAEEELVVFARLPDEHIVSRATGPNQRMWELGDTFEMFFQAEGRDDYVELHVTPHGHRLQMRIPSAPHFAENRGHGAFEDYLLPDPSFESQTEIRNGEWLAFVQVPWSLVGEAGAWRFCLCRYDFDELDKDPILSSISNFRELDFHRVQDWRTIRFEECSHSV